MRGTRRGIALFAGTAVLVALVHGVPLEPPAARAQMARPNVLVIVTDDQRWDTIDPRYMPNTYAALVERGTLFTNAFVTNPLCCPSRASILTGLFSHQNRMYSNRAPRGGYVSFDPTRTIATVLHDAGYRTAMIGKYMNGYPRGHWEEVPPGWDRWVAIGSGEYYGYQLAVDGRASRVFRSRPADYSGRVLRATAVAFLRMTQVTYPDQPFFLYYAPVAPHQPLIADPMDVGRFANEPPVEPPSLGNAGVSPASPAYIRNVEWTEERASAPRRFQQQTLDLLYGVDRELGAILELVAPNTLIIFTSDNGVLWGEHRWLSKQVPYEESIRVPLLMRLPGQTAPTVDERLALNVDIPATILQVVGLPSTTPTGVDMWSTPLPPQGTSLAAPPTRTDFVLEHFNHDRAVPTYCGVRTQTWTYVRYATGEQELYDVVDDPYQLANLAPTDATAVEALRARTRELCAPTPPGFDPALLDPAPTP